MSVNYFWLKSFKSFSTKHESLTISFNSSFIVLCGRNGCGKSAIIDALMFCLFNKHDERSAAKVQLINSNDKNQRI